MNKIYSFSAGLTVLVMLLMSCKNSTFMNGGEYPHLIKLDSIRDVYNSKRPKEEWTSVLKGRAKLTKTTDRISIEFVPDAGPEEMIIYFLQGATKDFELKSDSIQKGEFLFLGRNLFVHSFKQRQAMLFSVRDDNVPNYVSGYKDVKQYTGFGLGARKFSKNSFHDNVPACLCEKLGSVQYSCSIGGDDAHGCANGTPDGSCEVSCSLSAYACCDIQK
ncbi:MAG: hypothetical protein ABJC12_09570 [Saprospiraceae bacterium]